MSAGRRYLLIYILFVLLIAATRIPVLWSSPFIYRGAEEQARGILPLHLDQGLLMPFNMYQFDEYNGGGMVVGLLAYPFFHFLGPTYLSLKIPALLFSLALFTLLFVIAYRFFDRRTAIVLGVMFVFAPAHYLERSLIAFGNHMEVATFVAAALLLFLIFQRREKTAGVIPRAGLMLLLGLVSGFGFYFMYDLLSFLVVLVLMYVATVRRWRFAALDGLCFAAAFYVGFLPWMVFHHDFLVVDYFYHLFREPPPDKVGSFNNLGLFVQAVTLNVANWFGAHDLPIGRKQHLPGAVFNALFLLVFASSYFYLAWRHRGQVIDLLRAWRPLSRRALDFSADHAILPLLVYVPLHLFVYGTTKYRGAEPLPPTRYLLVLFPVYFLLAAAAVRALWENGRRLLAALLVLAAVVASFGGNAFYFSGGRGGEPLRRPGYSYQYFMEMFARCYVVRWKYDYHWPFAERQFPRHEGDYTIGAASGVAFLGGRSIDGELRAAAQGGPQALAAFTAGMGIAPRCADKVDPRREQLLRAVVPAGYEPFFDFGRRQICPPPR